MSAPSSNFIIKKCEFSQREEKTLRTAGKNQKTSRINARKNKSRKNKLGHFY
jgi:hypothetical protein